MIEFIYENVAREHYEPLKMDDMAVLYFCAEWVFRAKGCWGLVRGMRQSWLTNGWGWTKAWRGSIWHWLPPDKLTPFIFTAIVKLMSYVSNRLQWLEKTALRESVALIWIGSDSWELSISTVSVLGKVVYLCFSWQSQQYFVRQVYRGATELYTIINDQPGRTLKHISAGTESWHTMPKWD